MLKIGDFSKVSRTTIKTLRYYDEIDLLSPSFVDPETNYRFYTTDDLIKLNEIIYLKQAGLNLDEIKLILSGDDLISLLTKRENELKKEIASIDKKLLHIKDILKKESEKMDVKITQKVIQKQMFFVKEGILKDYTEINDFISSAISEAFSNNKNLKIADGYNFMVYRENEYKPTNVKLSYYTAVKEKGEDSKNIKFVELKETKAICAYHKGEYANLGKVYSEVYKYIYDNGYEPSDYPRESYIKGPWNEEEISNYLTEIQVPIK